MFPVRLQSYARGCSTFTISTKKFVPESARRKRKQMLRFFGRGPPVTRRDPVEPTLTCGRERTPQGETTDTKVVHGTGRDL